jgi:hypothetical protein
MLGRARIAGPALTITLALLVGACNGTNGTADSGGVDAGAPDSGQPGIDAGRDAGVDAGPKVYPPVAAAQYCEQRAQAFCARAVRCGYLDPADLAACVSTDAEICGVRFVGAAATSGRISFDAQLAGNCVGALTDDVCKSEHLPAACKTGFIVGKVAAGSACFQNFECVSGSYCNVAPQTCNGMCTKYVEAIGFDGGACSLSSEQCDPAKLWCDIFGSNTCQPLGTPMGNDGGPSICPYGYAASCAANSTCTQVDAGADVWACLAAPAVADLSGACTWGVAPGCLASPATFEQYGELYCRADYNDPSGTCEPQIPEGGACTQITEYEPDPIYDQCEAGTVCSAFYATGTCDPLAGDGQPCDSYYDCKWSRRPSDYVDYRANESYTVCDSFSHTCQYYYPGPGQSCASTFQCSNAWCDFTSLICQPLRPLGQPCDYTSAECISGNCGFGDAGSVTVCIPPCNGDPDAGYFEDAGTFDSGSPAADAGDGGAAD